MDESAARYRRIAEEIRRAIVGGTLVPGERLTESRLAAQYRVSRIPVREALRHLESEGFVTTTPHRGAVVGHVGPHEATDLVEVREVLETLIVRRAAERCAPDDVAWLTTIIAEGEQAIGAGDHTLLPALNARFHDAVATIADNAIAARVASQLREKIEWAYAAGAQARAERSWAEHVELASALAAGDGRAAVRVMRRHIGQAGAARRRTEHLEATYSEAVRSRAAPRPSRT